MWFCRQGLSLYKRYASFLAYYGSAQRENLGFDFDFCRYFYVESSSTEGFWVYHHIIDSHEFCFARHLSFWAAAYPFSMGKDTAKDLVWLSCPVITLGMIVDYCPVKLRFFYSSENFHPNSYFKLIQKQCFVGLCIIHQWIRAQMENFVSSKIRVFNSLKPLTAFIICTLNKELKG